MKYLTSVGFDADTRHMQVYVGGLVILWSWQTYLLSTMDSFWQTPCFLGHPGTHRDTILLRHNQVATNQGYGLRYW